MNKFYDWIGIPMGYALKYLSALIGNNFAVAVFLFTLIVNLILIPLTIKSQRSTVQQARIKPKLDDLKKKCGDDKQKYSQEMQALYQRENVSMSGGCLPIILRMVFMMGIYSAIRNPLQYICGVSASAISAGRAEHNISDVMQLLPFVKAGDVAAIPASVLDKVDFTFFGIDLTQTPVFSWDFSKAQLIWIIPILSFAAQMISSIISMQIQKKANPDAPNMALMMLTMPLISLWIGFKFPGALGFYWACSAIIAGAIQTVISLKYGPNTLIAKEQTQDIYKRYKDEQNRKQKAEVIE